MTLSKGEREDLLRAARSRGKVLKHAAESRAKELVADFEQQMASIYSYADALVTAREFARFA